MPLPPGPAAMPDDAVARGCSPREQRRRSWIAAGAVLIVVLSVFAADHRPDRDERGLGRGHRGMRWRLSWPPGPVQVTGRATGSAASPPAAGSPAARALAVGHGGPDGGRDHHRDRAGPARDGPGQRGPGLPAVRGLLGARGFDGVVLHRAAGPRLHAPASRPLCRNPARADRRGRRDRRRAAASRAELAAAALLRLAVLPLSEAEPRRRLAGRGRAPGHRPAPGRAPRPAGGRPGRDGRAAGPAPAAPAAGRPAPGRGLPAGRGRLCGRGHGRAGQPGPAAAPASARPDSASPTPARWASRCRPSSSARRTRRWPG